MEEIRYIAFSENQRKKFTFSELKEFFSDYSKDEIESALANGTLLEKGVRNYYIDEIFN